MLGYLSRPAAVLMLLLGASAATAHDYWLEPDGQDYLLYRGHRYSQHQGEAVVPYEPSIDLPSVPTIRKKTDPVPGWKPS